MVETPAPISVHPPDKRLPVASLVLGISSNLVAFIGIITGLLGIIFGAIALHKNTSGKPLAVAGIVTGGVGILFNVAIIFLLGFLFGNLPNLPIFHNDRNDAVTAQLNEKKDFVIGDKIKIGPTDVEITKVQRNYTLLPDEVKEFKDSLPEEMTDKSRYYGTAIKEDDAEYVVVTTKTTSNGSPSLGDSTGFGEMQLNNVDPYYYGAPGTNDEAQGTRIIYRIRKDSDSLTLKYVTTIYTAVSPIVGTEGMPRKQLVYTIKLH